MSNLGQVVVAFFEDHLKVQKGLRITSVRSYRDTLKLFLAHVAGLCRKPVTRLALADLSSERVLDFLRTIESERGNQVRTRNQRLAALRTFYRYLAVHQPESLSEAQRVEAIPTKRTSAQRTIYLERDEVEALFKALPTKGRLALRDRALLMFLYNTGARVQEVSDLRLADVDLEEPCRVRLHGKGDKWRTCPIWPETAELLKQITAPGADKHAPVFASFQRKPLTRFGVYKIVRRCTASLQCQASGEKRSGVFPHAPPLCRIPDYSGRTGLRGCRRQFGVNFPGIVQTCFPDRLVVKENTDGTGFQTSPVVQARRPTGSIH